METSFIDKIFDAYLKSDYSYGDDNLNPKREITKDIKVDTNDELDKILSKVHSKIQEIGKKYKDSPLSSKVSLNLNDDGKNKGGRKSLDLFQSDEDTEYGIDKDSAETDGIESALIEIDNLIPKILISLYHPTPTPLGGTPPIPPIPHIDVGIIGNEGDGYTEEYKGEPPLPPEIGGVDAPDVYKIDCSGVLNIVEKSSSNNENNDDDSEESTNGSGNEDDDKDKSDSNDSTSTDSSMENLKIARDKYLQDVAKNINRNNASARECAIADLKILKMISSVLRTLRGIKTFVDSFVNPAMETCQIIVLAAQCWNNPTCIQEILNRILQKVQSILIMVTCKLLQLLWNLLGLDCVTTQVQSAIMDIKSLLAGIDSIFSEVNRTALNLGNSFDKMKDAFSDVSESVNEALNYSISDRLRDQIDLEEFAKNAGNFDESFKNNLQSEVESSKAYDSVMKTVDMFKNLGKSFDNVKNSYLKVISKDSEVNKFASRFKNIKAK